MSTIDLSDINPEEYYEAQTIADKLQVTYRTIWKRTKHGGLPSVRMNRQRYIKGQDLFDWIEAQKAGHSSKAPAARPPKSRVKPRPSSVEEPMDIFRSIYPKGAKRWT